MPGHVSDDDDDDDNEDDDGAVADGKKRMFTGKHKKSVAVNENAGSVTNDKASYKEEDLALLFG